MAQKLWLKRILIPIWVLQLLICAILAAVSIIALYVFGKAVAQGDFGGTSGVIAALNGSVAAALALSIITILLDLLEIILLAKQKLKPAPHLGFQVVKGGAWTIWFFLVVAAYVKNQESGFALLLAGLLCVTSLAQLVYGSVIYHRQRKGTLARGEYAPATTAQPVTQQIALEEPMFKAYQPPRADASIDIEDSARPPHRPGAYSNGVLYEE